MKRQKIGLVLMQAFLLTGCEWLQTSKSTPAQQTNAVTTAQHAGATNPCSLAAGQYPVHEARHYRADSRYELMLMGAPACLPQPYVVNELKLAPAADGETAKAKFELTAAGEQVLYLAPDFEIKLLEPLVENGQVVGEKPSLWQPFLAGAAGAAVGGLLMNSLSRRPQYYTPPPAAPVGSPAGPLRGYGGAGVSREAAVAAHTRAYGKAPSSGLASQAQAPAKNKGFFKRSSDKQESGSVQRSYQRQAKPGMAKKRGFFRGRRR